MVEKNRKADGQRDKHGDLYQCGQSSQALESEPDAEKGCEEDAVGSFGDEVTGDDEPRSGDPREKRDCKTEKEEYRPPLYPMSSRAIHKEECGQHCNYERPQKRRQVPAIVAALELIGKHTREKARNEAEKRGIVDVAHVEEAGSDSDDPDERDAADGAGGTQEEGQPGEENVHVPFERQGPRRAQSGNAGRKILD